jgi:hypothetical protein
MVLLLEEVYFKRWQEPEGSRPACLVQKISFESLLIDESVAVQQALGLR